MNTEAHRELLADSLRRTLTELNLSFESLEQASEGQGGGDVFRLVAEALVEQPQFRQAYMRAHGGREIGKDIDERNVVDSWKKGLREWISGKRNMGDSTIRILNQLAKPVPQAVPVPYKGWFKSSQIKTVTGLFLLCIGIAIFSPYLLKTFPESLPQVGFSANGANTVLFKWLILSFMLVLIAFTALSGKDQKKGLEMMGRSPYLTTVKRSFTQLFRAWIGLWISWNLLYLCLFLCWGIDGVSWQRQSFIWVGFADLFNGLSGVCFLYMFGVLDRESVGEESQPFRAGKFPDFVIAIFGMAFLTVLISILDRYYGFSGDLRLGPILLSIFTGISMMFFFGRLDSHFFKAPRYLLAGLYGYALIQILYPDFFAPDFLAQEPQTEGRFFLALPAARLIFTALILKFLLLVVISDWMRNGKFHVYFRKHLEYADDLLKK